MTLKTFLKNTGIAENYLSLMLQKTSGHFEKQQVAFLWRCAKKIAQPCNTYDSGTSAKI